MLQDGIYEQLINHELAKEISEVDSAKIDIKTEKLDQIESPEILSKYIAAVLQKRFEIINEELSTDEARRKQIEETNKVFETLQFDKELSLPGDTEQLLSFFNRQNSILSLDEKAAIIRPEPSSAQSSLFTGAVNDPQMYSELKKEILSCNRSEEHTSELQSPDHLVCRLL